MIYLTIYLVVGLLVYIFCRMIDRLICLEKEKEFVEIVLKRLDMEEFLSHELNHFSSIFIAVIWPFASVAIICSTLFREILPFLFKKMNVLIFSKIGQRIDSFIDKGIKRFLKDKEEKENVQ